MHTRLESASVEIAGQMLLDAMHEEHEHAIKHKDLMTAARDRLTARDADDGKLRELMEKNGGVEAVGQIALEGIRLSTIVKERRNAYLELRAQLYAHDTESSPELYDHMSDVASDRGRPIKDSPQA